MLNTMRIAVRQITVCWVYTNASPVCTCPQVLRQPGGDLLQGGHLLLDESTPVVTFPAASGMLHGVCVWRQPL